MGGGSVTAQLVQDLLNGMAVVVLKKTPELNLSRAKQERSRSEAAPGTSVQHVSKDTGAQICDGRYASTYQLAHCSHQPTSPEPDPTEFPVQRQEPCRNEGNFEVGSYSFGRARGSSTATSPSFRQTTPWRDRASVNTTRSPPERDDAFANSLRKYPSTTSYPSEELFQRFLRRQSKLLDKALRHTKSLRTLTNSKHSNISIRKSFKSINLNRKKKEQTVADSWIRQFVAMQTTTKQKGFRSSGCRAPGPRHSKNIRAREPCDNLNSRSPRPRPATGSEDRKAAMDSIRECLRSVYGHMGVPLASTASYIVCPRMSDRLSQRRRKFHEPEAIASTASYIVCPRMSDRLSQRRRKLHEPEAIASYNVCPRMSDRLSQHRRKFHEPEAMGKNRSRSKSEKEKVLCECEETVQERRDAGPSCGPCERLEEKCCPCDPKTCDSDLGKVICDCPVKKLRPSSDCDCVIPPPTSDCDCVIEDWLSELPIQAREKPMDEATREKIIKDLIKTLNSMDEDKFNELGLNEIKIHVREMPMWLPNDKERKETFVDEISKNLLRRIKEFRSAKGMTRKDELSDELANKLLISPKEGYGYEPVVVHTDKLTKNAEELVLNALNEISEFDIMSETKKRMAAKDVIQQLSDSPVDGVLRFYIVHKWLDQLLRDNSINLAPEMQRQLATNIVQGTKAVQAKFSRQSPDSRRFADGRPTSQYLRNPSPFRQRLLNGQHLNGKRHECLHLDKEPSKGTLKKSTPKRISNEYPKNYTTRPEQDMSIIARDLDPSKYSYYQDADPYTSGTQSSYNDPKLYTGNGNPIEYPSEIRTGTQHPSQNSPKMRPGTQEKSQYPPEMRPGSQDASQYFPKMRPGTQDPSQYSPGIRPGTQEQRQYTSEMRHGNLDPNKYPYDKDTVPYTSDMQSSNKDPKHYAGNLNSNQYPSEIRPGTQDPSQYSPAIRPGTQEQRQYTSEMRHDNLDPNKYPYDKDTVPYTSDTQSSNKDPKHYAGNLNPNQYPSEISPGTQDPSQYSPGIRPGTQEQRQYTSEMRHDNLDPNKYPYDKDTVPYTSDTRSSNKDPKHYAGNLNPNQYPSEIRPGTQDPSQYSPAIRSGTQEQGQRQNSLEITPDNLVPDHPPFKSRPGIQEKDTLELRPRNLDSKQYPSDKTPGNQGPRRHSPVKRPGYSDNGQSSSNTPSSRQDPRKYSPAIKSGYQDRRYSPDIYYPSDKRPGSQYLGRSGRASGPDRPLSDIEPASPDHEKKTTLPNKEPSSTNEQFRDKIGMPNLTHGTSDKERISKESEFETTFTNLIKNEDINESAILMELLNLLEQVNTAGIHSGDLQDKLVKHITELSKNLTNNQSHLSHPYDGTLGATPEKINIVLGRYNTDEKEDPIRNRSKNIARPKSISVGPSRSIQSPRTPSRSPDRSLGDQRRRGRVEKQIGTTRPSLSPKKAMDERTASSNLNGRRMSPSSTITRSKSSGREPGKLGNSAENIPGKPKSKIERVYFKELQNKIHKWIDDLGIDLKGNERILSSVIADEVLDRQKYLQLNPNVNTSDGEELEDMKYQIFRMLKKKVEPGTIKVIMTYVGTLMRDLKDVPVPSLAQTKGKI